MRAGVPGCGLDPRNLAAAASAYRPADALGFQCLLAVKREGHRSLLAANAHSASRLCQAGPTPSLTAEGCSLLTSLSMLMKACSSADKSAGSSCSGAAGRGDGETEKPSSCVGTPQLWGGKSAMLQWLPCRHECMYVWEPRWACHLLQAGAGWGGCGLYLCLLAMNHP